MQQNSDVLFIFIYILSYQQAIRKQINVSLKTRNG